jgi:uncharacterized membrane protein HdeD (DUF308 family)
MEKTQMSTKASTETPRKFRWKVFGAGMAAIVAGYVLLALNDITFAPILLVVGYCVLVPLAFL